MRLLEDFFGISLTHLHQICQILKLFCFFIVLILELHINRKRYNKQLYIMYSIVSSYFFAQHVCEIHQCYCISNLLLRAFVHKSFCDMLCYTGKCLKAESMGRIIIVYLSLLGVNKLFSRMVVMFRTPTSNMSPLVTHLCQNVVLSV